MYNRVMIRFILLISVLALILFILSKKNTIKRGSFDRYKKLMIIIIFLGFLFLLATSGKFIIPQILQILKIGLPLLTKFIGL